MAVGVAAAVGVGVGVDVGVGVGLAVGIGVTVGVGAGVAGPLPIVNTEVAIVLFPPWFTASIRKLNGTP